MTASSVGRHIYVVKGTRGRPKTWSRREEKELKQLNSSWGQAANRTKRS